MAKKILYVLILLALIAAAGFFYKSATKDKEVVVSEDVMVERITNIGKLELVKYTMKDVIERKELRSFYLPDQRVLFVAVGEVTGCIDLTKVKKEDIERHGPDSLTIYLPEPEICYVKVDHQRSKVYDVSGAWWPGDTQNLVEGIYKIAEQRLLDNAKEMDVLGKTRENAMTIFKPMVENIAGQHIEIAFR
ncbi:DUF4230 domain-containing protein [Olivibacter sitiensis]|uniref:DUF4230 domain-containing protein n=1 Tax=Olivibacter sitiensis TaxID=376470 RepID=UPI00040A9F72|nr:DUF4230 domain-containing protein [Olivibacter sitiensis]